MGITILLNLFGGVAMLLWGLHMVHTSIVRAFGARLRLFLSTVLKNRVNAFFAGIGVTALLQSSTATALMLNSFLISGLVDLVPSLAIMLGANVGTTLTVQLLSFDTSAVSPFLLTIGVITVRRSNTMIIRELAKACIGLGLMLMSLHLLLASLGSTEHDPMMGQIFGSLTNDPLLTLLIGAVMTWAAHSSVATVLLTMSLVSSHLISPSAGLALVLGANLGSALVPLMEGGSSKNPALRRMPVGNLINRLIGCIVFLPFLEPITRWMGLFEPNSARIAADFHTIFNVVLAVTFILPLPFFAKLLERVLPDIKETADPRTPVYLDESVLETPTVALTCAARETLRMGDIVDDMLQKSMIALFANDQELSHAISLNDDIVDHLNEAIKLYVIKMTRDSLGEVEGYRAMEILSFAINLEHIGDIIDKNLLEVVNKKIRHNLEFSPEGAEEVRQFYLIVRENLRLAMTVFLSSDVKTARELLDEKYRIREIEFTASENHLARLRDGKIMSLDTSSLHLELLRDLKRIHSHICSAAYPALEAAGEIEKLGQVSFSKDHTISKKSLML
jgi:phosphate:Na+ symporter